MSENYYVSSRKSLLRSFDRASKWALIPLVNRYSRELAHAVVVKARAEYEALIPQIPYIGGAKNRWTSDIIEAVQILAFFRAMQAYGKSSRETTELLHEAMRSRLARYPGFLLRLIGRVQFSRLFLKKLKAQAAQSQRRIYPGDFVAEIVEGDGQEFDWGIDFTECAIHKFYRAQNALDFLPFVCRLDYLTSTAFGLGLVRTKSLANGDERCNPRLKHGRDTIQVVSSRPTETLL